MSLDFEETNGYKDLLAEIECLNLRITSLEENNASLKEQLDDIAYQASMNA